MQASNPWDPTAPNPAACFLQKCLGSGMLTQEVLEWNKVQFGNSVPFVLRFKQLDAVSNTRAELQQKSLDIKLLQLQNDTADIAHPEYLDCTNKKTEPNSSRNLGLLHRPKSILASSAVGVDFAPSPCDYVGFPWVLRFPPNHVQIAEKYKCLQLMNSHLERILQEKMMLKQRLVKPACHQCLPVEANCHRYVSELLTRMVQVIEQLDTNLQLIKTIPLLPQKVKTMEDLVGRMVSEILELKEVMEFIMKWREQQKTIGSEYLDWNV